MNSKGRKRKEGRERIEERKEKKKRRKKEKELYTLIRLADSMTSGSSPISTCAAGIFVDT
jgi:hypothetical protein